MNCKNQAVLLHTGAASRSRHAAGIDTILKLVLLFI